MFDQVFANLATGFSAQFGGPYMDAAATWPGTPVKDAGGSIITPGSPTSVPCKVQFDDATVAMRNAPDFLQTDVRLLVLTGELDTKAKIVVDAPAEPIDTDAKRLQLERAGTWALLSCDRDPVGIGFECRGRRAS